MGKIMIFTTHDILKNHFVKMRPSSTTTQLSLKLVRFVSSSRISTIQVQAVFNLLPNSSCVKSIPTCFDVVKVRLF